VAVHRIRHRILAGERLPHDYYTLARSTSRILSIYFISYQFQLMRGVYHHHSIIRTFLHDTFSDPLLWLTNNVSNADIFRNVNLNSSQYVCTVN
jgi:hypothetical protein